MCNLYTQSKSVDEVARLFRELQMPLVFPEGAPNLSPRDIAITDPGPIVRLSPEGSFELVIRRWSWPGAGGKPVYNFRSDGREFPSARCLILADGFYEFTAPADPKARRKDRWLFTFPGEGMLGIAGLTRDMPVTGEAFTMLTTDPGPDVAPYHNRQVAVLPQERWRAWLDGSAPAGDLLRPLAAGSLEVRHSPRPDS
jgi:putative SOS response-associated peptidase YedK